ncbi:MAG: nucleotidyltransferase [Candidatus Dormibacteria bacterium]
MDHPRHAPAASPAKMDETAKKRHIDEPIVDEATFVRVLRTAVEALKNAGIEHMLMGGIASTLLGRKRWTHDIDVFVREDDAKHALEVLHGAGFATQETFEDWLYKAIRDRVLVDIIFASTGGITVDDEMIARSVTGEWADIPVRVIGPEDLVVIKALADSEESPRHFHDAVAVLERTPLDWDYFNRRAEPQPARVASVLLYARSEGVDVPFERIRHFIDLAGSA